MDSSNVKQDIEKLVKGFTSLDPSVNLTFGGNVY